MSRLDELIAELCPDGVKYRKLEDVIISLTTGLNPRKFFTLNTKDANNYYVTIREIHDQKIVFSDKTDKINDSALAMCNNRSKLEIGDILFSGTGTIGEVAVINEYPYNWNIKEGVYSIKPNKLKINSKYVMYVLSSSSTREKYMKKAAGGTVKSVPMGELRKLIIPVPPLPVQEEVVRILDNFAELTAELTAELAKRKQQYQYYRNTLVDLKDGLDRPFKINKLIADLCPNGVEYKTLGELATDIFRGSGITRDQVRKSGTPCVRYGEIYTTYGVWFEECVSFTDESIIPSKKYFEYGDILFAITGEKVEDIAKSCVYIGKEKCLIGGDIVVMKHTQNPKYMGYALSTSSAQAQKSKGKVKSKVVHSSIPSIKEIVIPVPPLPIQEEIVRILDRFDALCNDLTSGLPAEIAARKKQYEYYRDKLLTFKGAV